MTARRLAWGIWGLTLVLIAAWPILGSIASSASADLAGFVLFPAATVVYATVGALIASRAPDNRIGLILAWIGFWFAASLASGAYAALSFDDGYDLPAAGAAAWVARAGFALLMAPIPLLFLLFPTGHVPTPRWRPLLVVLLAALAVNVTLFALTPGTIDAGFGEFDTQVVNPFALPLAWKDVVESVTELAGLVALLCSALAVVSLVIRFRRSEGEERQQIRWLAYIGGLLASIMAAGLVSSVIRETLGFEIGETDVFANAMFLAFFLVLMFGVPTACGIAILRYRLYDLDVVVKKTVIFAILIALIMAVGGSLALAASSVLTDAVRDETQALGIAMFAIGVLVWPLYRSSRGIADRVVYGGRANSGEVLSEFTERMGETYSTEDVLPRMAQLLGQAARARAATVWLRVGDELRSEARWPDPAARRRTVRVPGDSLPDLGEEAFEVRHQGELLGALTVQMSPSDPMNPSKERIARGLASQAGLVLRNVRLIGELRESRRRIVTTQDERAKKLERNIHDGAQQQLVALMVKQRLASSALDNDTEHARALLDEILAETSEALKDLRDLARGIYPPLLADSGLPAALEGQARKSSVPTAIDPDGIGRYPPEMESAVYFSCLEALQNVAKYARASHATIELHESDGELTFAIVDDGVGFDPDGIVRGTGLPGMTDRISAIGGRLEIHSNRDGTSIRGYVPIAREMSS